MRAGKENNSCSLAGGMLSYLYDEMSGGDRDRFETHLADCSICIEDFAELSQGRYPVFEWRKLEFDLLATPRIVIPSGVARVGLLERIRVAFAFPAFRMAGAFAGILSVMAIGYAAYLGSLDPANLAVATPLVNAADGLAELPDVDSAVVASSEVRMSVPVTPSGQDEKIERRTAAMGTPKAPRRRSAEPRSVQAKSTRPAESNLRQPALPVLSTRIEEDDSLRLADLFEDIGGVE